jgi:putative chitinase
MTVIFDRQAYFDSIRESLFGVFDQQQVDGQNALLDAWESAYPDFDLRWLAYALATTYHETSERMQPIEEYGKGSGMDYGELDSETGQAYYGRGFCQLTWRDNYARADRELGLKGDDSCEWHADKQLDAVLAAQTLYLGMIEGWFRTRDGKPETLGRYFSETTDDPHGARGIINGDEDVIPSWSGGESIGELVAGYHKNFLAALEEAYLPVDDEDVPTVSIDFSISSDKSVRVVINGVEWKP